MSGPQGLNSFAVALVALGVAGLSGVNAASAQTGGRAPDLEIFQSALTQQGQQNRVLNQMEVGARSLWLEQYDVAALAFDDCIVNIETVFADDQSALQARSIWHEEGGKTFKGEPYERAMVFFYRGMLYLRAGDYENARASFRRGQLQDAFAEEQQNQSDFAILYFLEAWASHLNGDNSLRDDALQVVARLRPDFPTIADDADTLILVETGTAPRKLGDGASHAYFVYRRGRGFSENRAVVSAGDTTIDLHPIEDIYFQAATRGGREIDRILEGKVQFREAGNTIGSALSSTSVAMAQMSGASDFGTALGAVGVVSSLIALNARPRADVRQWTSLPDTIHVATVNSARLGGQLRVSMRSGSEPAEILGRDALTFQDPRSGRMSWVRSR